MDPIKKIVPLHGEEEYSALFETVTKKYQISIQSLSKITGIDEEVIVRQEYDHELTDLKHLLVILSTGMEQVNENDRVKAIIEVLHRVYHITSETIALYSKVELDDVVLFLKGDYHSIPFEKRYRIAVTAMFLHYLFKPATITKT